MIYQRLEEYLPILDVKTNLRHISVIANVNHGKSTLLELLYYRAGIIANRDDALRWYDARPTPNSPVYRFEPTVMQMYFELDKDILSDVRQETKGNKFLVYLTECPGHVEYSSDVTAFMRISDGAVLVVDCVEGVCMQTESLLRQALMERVRPVLFVNKVDRALLELQLDPEALYALFLRSIKAVNASISTYYDEALGNCQVSPDVGNVAFGSALHGWAFTLHQFAVRYSKIFGINREKMMERLWGDNFYNESTKEWTTSPVTEDGTPNQRGFCKLVLEPIYEMYALFRNNDNNKLMAIIERLNIQLSDSDIEVRGERLLKKIMHHLMPPSDALFEIFAIHLPSPVTAQKYRAEVLYDGPIDDDCAVGIRHCDPEGPVMLYVSMMVPAIEMGRFFALGRVYSGTLLPGKKLRILGPHFKPGKKRDLSVKAIQRTVLLMGRDTMPIENCPVGNIIGLMGLNQLLIKSAAITTSETAHNMNIIKCSASQLVRVTVNVKDPNDLPELVHGLEWLSKMDPCVRCYMTDSGEHIVASPGGLHLDSSLHCLEYDRACVPLVFSDPVVQYCETICQASSRTALSLSTNGHNRIFMIAQPMDEEVTVDMEQGRGFPRVDFQACSRYLSETDGWEVGDAHRIWCVGPNVLVDTTKAVEHLDKIKPSVVSGFQQATAEGVLCGEPLRACRFNITDATLHADAIHRSDDEIASTARSVIHAAQLLSEPALLEPVFLVVIQCTDRAVKSVYDVLIRRRAIVISELQRPGTSMFTIKAHMAVSESFGLAADLCTYTAGQAFPQCIFDHWQLVPGSPLDPTSKAGTIVTAIRKRKGLSAEVPRLESLLDRV